MWAAALCPFKLFLNFRNNLLMLSNNLSRTFALGLYHKGMKEEKAAAKSIRMARRMISWRMMLDRLSAAVYLATFRIDCFKAVLKAHKEYRKLRRIPSQKQICSYLGMYGTSAEVKGIYRKWIVLLSMLKGQKVFGSIRAEDFYKF